MRIWSSLLRNPTSNLHGFDSFEGLPESWDLSLEKGHFAMDGSVPVIDDSRVSFVKGWFSETLPQYVLPPHEQLFVNFDADRYSSTKTVLDLSVFRQFPSPRARIEGLRWVLVGDRVDIPSRRGLPGIEARVISAHVGLVDVRIASSGYARLPRAHNEARDSNETRRTGRGRG
jgi:hypothetical protein